MFKKILILSAFLVVTFNIQKVMAFDLCMVTTESDRNTEYDDSTLRNHIEQAYNTWGDYIPCKPDAFETSYFDAGIIFKTKEILKEEDESNNYVKKIVLNKNPIHFSNPKIEIVLGNWTTKLGRTEIAYDEEYLKILGEMETDDYGRVTIDGNSLPEDQPAFTCSKKSATVWLRNMTVYTNVPLDDCFKCAANCSFRISNPAEGDDEPDVNPNPDNNTDNDGDGFTADVDCNDNNARVNPEVRDGTCDGIDNNCNGVVDDGKNFFYQDADGDGFGNPDAKLLENVCFQDENYVDNRDDCNDTNPNGPEEDEITCNDGIDNDCNGLMDAQDTTCANFTGVDLDGDGVDATNDCDDNNANIYPGAMDCFDEIDNDCDLETDEDSDSEECLMTDPDVDNDADNYTENQGDCNDKDETINPGVDESAEAGNADDGDDNDCDGIFDEEFDIADPQDEESSGGCALINHNQNQNAALPLMMMIFASMIAIIKLNKQKS